MSNIKWIQYSLCVYVFIAIIIKEEEVMICEGAGGNTHLICTCV